MITCSNWQASFCVAIFFCCVQESGGKLYQKLFTLVKIVLRLDCFELMPSITCWDTYVIINYLAILVIDNIRFKLAATPKCI